MAIAGTDVQPNRGMTENDQAAQQASEEGSEKRRHQTTLEGQRRESEMVRPKNIERPYDDPGDLVRQVFRFLISTDLLLVASFPPD